MKEKQGSPGPARVSYITRLEQVRNTALLNARLNHARREQQEHMRNRMRDLAAPQYAQSPRHNRDEPSASSQLQPRRIGDRTRRITDRRADDDDGDSEEEDLEQPARRQRTSEHGQR